MFLRCWMCLYPGLNVSSDLIWPYVAKIVFAISGLIVELWTIFSLIRFRQATWRNLTRPDTVRNAWYGKYDFSDILFILNTLQVDHARMGYFTLCLKHLLAVQTITTHILYSLLPKPTLIFIVFYNVPLWIAVVVIFFRIQLILWRS
jgi:hypothetical protein